MQAQTPDIILINSKSTSPNVSEAVQAASRGGKDVSVVVVLDALREEDISNALRDAAHAVALATRSDQFVAVVRREAESLTMRRSVRRLETALRESERRCNVLLESSRDPVAYVHEGMHVRANKAYLEMFGYEDFDEIEGVSILDMIAPEAADGFKTLLKNLSKGEKPPAKLDIKARGANGKSFDAVMEFTEASYEGEPCQQIVLRRPVASAELAAEIDVAALEGSRHRSLQPRARPQRAGSHGRRSGGGHAESGDAAGRTRSFPQATRHDRHRQRRSAARRHGQPHAPPSRHGGRRGAHGRAHVRRAAARTRRRRHRQAQRGVAQDVRGTHLRDRQAVGQREHQHRRHADRREERARPDGAQPGLDRTARRAGPGRQPRQHSRPGPAGSRRGQRSPRNAQSRAERDQEQRLFALLPAGRQPARRRGRIPRDPRTHGRRKRRDHAECVLPGRRAERVAASASTAA